jgi:hypothetical protein
LNLTNTLPYTLATLCSQCYAHYEYAVVEVDYLDFDEEEDTDDESVDEDPSSSEEGGDAVDEESEDPK